MFEILKICAITVNYFFAIVLMLLIMTFNVYVILAISLGSLISYMFFNIQMEVDSDEGLEKAKCGCEC